METVVLSSLSTFQKNAVMDYIASIQGFTRLNIAYHYSTCAAPIEFPHNFFHNLRQQEAEAEREAQAVKNAAAAAATEAKLSASVHSIALSSRGRSLAWLLKLIDEFFVYRSRQFNLEVAVPHHHLAHRSQGPIVDDVSVHLFAYLTKTFGMHELVKSTARDLLEAIKKYRSLDLEVQIFGVLLSSACFDTLDVRKMVDWRVILAPYCINKQDRLLHNNSSSELATSTSTADVVVVQRRFVRVCEVPALLRKCCTGDATTGTWNRCRSALPQWCDRSCRFPGVVEDPNFYTFPFPVTNPFIGRPQHVNGLSLNEARFHTVNPDCIVHVSQVIMLLLLNWKEERNCPTEWAKRRSHNVRDVRSAQRLRSSPAASQRTKSPPASVRNQDQSMSHSYSLSKAPESSVPLVPSVSPLPQMILDVPFDLFSSPSPPRPTSPRHRKTMIVPPPPTSSHKSLIVNKSFTGSPTLREHEAQFDRDVQALEARLSAAVDGIRKPSHPNIRVV